MIVGIAKETYPGECRVALVPAVLLLLGIASRRRTASSDER